MPYPYHERITEDDKVIIDKPIQELVHDIQSSHTSPLTVLRTYGKIAVKAQERTNCVTELLLPEAESWLESDVNLKGPLAGIPVSLKDSVHVKGFDTSLGYSALANQPVAEDGPMTRLLKDAGKNGAQTQLMASPDFLTRHQEPFHTPRLRCQSPCYPSNPPTVFGVTAATLMSLITVRVVQRVERLLSSPRGDELALALTLRARFAYRPLGVASTHSAAVPGVGPKLE